MRYFRSLLRRAAASPASSWLENSVWSMLLALGLVWAWQRSLWLIIAVLVAWSLLRFFWGFFQAARADPDWPQVKADLRVGLTSRALSHTAIAWVRIRWILFRQNGWRSLRRYRIRIRRDAAGRALVIHGASRDEFPALAKQLALGSTQAPTGHPPG
jgi:hypothetical protein